MEKGSTPIRVGSLLWAEESPDFLIFHIRNLCGVQVDPHLDQGMTTYQHIRYVVKTDLPLSKAPNTS